MKLVTAVVRPFSVEPIKDALSEVGIKGMTVSEVRGFGSQGGHKETYRGTEYSVPFLRKEKIEIIVSDEQVDRVVEAICSTGRTGEMGDGKIWVSAIERLVRVRTGEEGKDAV